MADLYFSGIVDNETTLCIAPLTDRRIAMSGQEIPDTSGYFLYATRKSEEPNEVEVIARLVSEDAAFALSQILGLE